MNTDARKIESSPSKIQLKMNHRQSIDKPKVQQIEKKLINFYQKEQPDIWRDQTLKQINFTKKY